MPSTDPIMFQEFLESVPDAIVGVDWEGRIVLVNVATEQMFGYARDELLGRLVEALVPDRHKVTHPHHRAIYLSNPTKRPMGAGLQLSALHKNGHEFPCDISLSTLRYEGSPITLAAVRDMTDRKRYETLFVSELTNNVSSLTSSVDKLAKVFEKEKTDRQRQRRRDWVLTGVLVGSLTLGLAATIYSVKNGRTSCEAVNEANKTIHDLFEPLNQFVPSAVPDSATPAERAAIKLADERRKAASDAFFKDLNERTAPRPCSLF